jgi:hypothetical protein
MMNKFEKLKMLLEQAKELDDFFWLSPLDLSKVVFSDNDNLPIPIENIKNIYSVRAKRNNDRGNPREGFSILMRNLNSVKAENLIIQRMTDIEGREYALFADSDISELFGVLKFPVGN